jgi:FkbM family methyltransferase
VDEDVKEPLGLKRRVLGEVRRQVVKSDWLNRHLPWRLWCAVGAADSLAVSWVIGHRAGRPLTFAQIGANDGVIWDPLHAVVRAYGWSGLLVEPIPDMFERLVANYEGVPNLSFENAAIGAADGTATLYSLQPRPGDPYWAELISSFDRATVCSHEGLITGVDERIVEIPVTSLTFPTLVSRHQLNSIDLLNVDTEGYDYEILKQIDFSSSWAPTFVIYERRHLDHHTDRAARRMLRGAGYRLADIWPDALAYRAAPETLGGNHGGRGRRNSRRA